MRVSAITTKLRDHIGILTPLLVDIATTHLSPNHPKYWTYNPSFHTFARQYVGKYLCGEMTFLLHHALTTLGYSVQQVETNG